MHTSRAVLMANGQSHLQDLVALSSYLGFEVSLLHGWCLEPFTWRECKAGKFKIHGYETARGDIIEDEWEVGWELCCPNIHFVREMIEMSDGNKWKEGIGGFVLGINPHMPDCLLVLSLVIGSNPWILLSLALVREELK